MNAKLFIVLFLALVLTVCAQNQGIKNLVTNQPPATVATTAAPEDLAVSCTFSGDPHVKTSFNAYYDFYSKGDYLLAQFSGVKVYGRFNHVANWPGRSVTTAVSVHVGNMRATYYAFERQLMLNGQKVPPVTVGKKFQTKSKNLVVTRIGDNKYVIEGGLVKVAFTINGNHEATDANRYLDVEIFASRKTVESPEYKGLCSKLREQILGNFDKPMRQITKFHKLKEHSRRRAKKFCRKLRHDEGKFHACVSDYVAGGAKLAQSSLDLDKNKDEIRTYFSQSEKCRDVLREFAQLNGKLTKTNPKDTKTVALIKQDIDRYSNEIIPNNCQGKHRSDKCKKAQKAYSDLANYYNNLGESASPAQRNSIYKILQGLGAKSRQICDIKGAINRCRKHRVTTINTLNANLQTIQDQIKKVQAQIKAEKAKTCKVDLSALKQFDKVRWQ